MKGRKPVFHGIVALLILLVAGMLIRVRTYDVITSGAQALGNNHELYILVAQNKLAWSQNFWIFLGRTGASALGLASPPTFRRFDCLLYHITAGTMEEYRIQGLNASGIFVPYRGSLYALFDEGGPRASRWNGHGFEPVSSAENTALQGSFTYTDELFKREDWWQINPLLPARGSADHALLLNKKPFTLRALQTLEGESRIELLETGHTRVLYAFKNNGGFLGPGAYKRFIN